MKSQVRRLAVPGALVLGLGTAATAVEVVRTSLVQAEAQTGAAPAPAPGGEAASLATAFRTASRAAFPAVVHIRVENQARAVAQQQIPDELRGTPFEGLFGSPRMQRMPSQTSGSGFIISPEGYILTNNHVVAEAQRVTVIMTDKRELSARVVGRDPNTDIAVIKVEAKGLPTVRLGSSDELQTGDWVLALGYPLTLGETTTAGIVSAKGKSIGIMEQNEGATAPLEHFIQTDAVINPGNSGGPLIDLQGRVVGINSAIASPTGYYNGYGFAIPVDLAKRVSDDLIRYGSVRRPMIGVNIRDVSTADQEVFRLPRPAGSVVSTEPTGPARAAGMQLGDVIVAVDGQPIADTGDLMERIARKQPGEKVALDVIRYGERKRFDVTLTTLQTSRSAAQRSGEAQDEDAAEAPTARLGFQAQEMDDAMARRYGLPSGGVIVTGVDGFGPAAGNVPQGMRIERVNGQAVGSLNDLRSAAGRLRPGQVVSLVGRTKDGRQVIVNYRVDTK